MWQWAIIKQVAGWLLITGLMFQIATVPAAAAGQFPDQTSNGSIGLQGTISSAPPTRAATISTPGSGAAYSSIPITVSGLCPAGTLVKLFANNVFVGSTLCQGGSYSVQIALFSGQNELVARVYDALDQAGPDSNVVTITYNDGQFAQFGTHVSLNSAFAVRGAPPGQQISWPITLSGGNGPYAVSIDWGDGSSADLLSQTVTGTFTISHTYKSAGVYRVIIKATDKNGGVAFLQLIGQANGAGQSNSQGGSSGSQVVRTEVIWWPAVAMVPLILAAFWVGRRHELFSLRNQLLKERGDE